MCAPTQILSPDVKSEATFIKMCVRRFTTRRPMETLTCVICAVQIIFYFVLLSQRIP